MIERMDKPLPFLEVVKEVALFYVRVFKPILPIVLVASAIQAVVSLLAVVNSTIGLAVSVLGAVASVFFSAWILYHADSVLMNRPETKKDALHVAKKRFLPLLIVFVLYVALTVLIFLFGFGMQYLGKILHIEWVFALITLCVLFFIFTLLAFTFPLVVLENTPAFKSFEGSVKLVWRHWWHTFGVFMAFLIPVMLLSLSVLLLPTRNIVVITVYEYIYHVITYPLMISMILVLFHDLKARHQMEGFKHVVERNDGPTSTP